MSENPLISILTPSFNHEKYVCHFINSLIAQTYTNWELIIVDDCSTDKNIEEIKKFTDSRIHLFVQDFNQGPGAALNKAFSESHGEIIVDMASDDMLYPDYFEYIVKIFSQKPEVGVIYSSLDVIDERNNVYKTYRLPHNKTRLEFLKDLFYKGNVLTSPGMTVRREVYSSIIPMGASMIQHQDYQWHINFLSRTECFVPEKVFVKYRNPRGENKSLSAFNKGEYNRKKLEIDAVMNSFFNITDFNMIRQITGLDICKELSNTCTKFIWGKAALLCDSKEKKIWGYKTICDCYNNVSIRIELNQKLGFNFSSFMKLASDKNYFDENEYKKHFLHQYIINIYHSLLRLKNKND